MKNIKKINEITSIFTNSNEHLESYKKIYDFDNATVISVVGSGDQYFTCILNGAKEVELFDINKAAWDYFRLRFYAIRVLCYEEYLIFFVLQKYDKCFFDGKLLNIYEIISKHIPNDLKEFLNLFVQHKNLIASELYTNIERSFSGETIVDRRGMSVAMPHFTKEEYYKLQSILNKTSLPKFRWNNLVELPGQLESGYDIMLFSNIYDYLNAGVEEYKNFLQQFDASIIQAHYLWYSADEMQEFLDYGFNVDAVTTNPNISRFNEFAISLKRTK